MHRYTVKMALGLLGILCSRGALVAQSLAPQSVNSAGHHFIPTPGVAVASISATVGELAVGTHHSASGHSLGGGVVAGARAVPLSVESLGAAPTGVRVYPNPVTEILIIDTETTGAEGQSVWLLDEKGAVAYHANDLKGTQVLSIPMDGLASGRYLLVLRDKKNALVGSFRIIKQ